MGKTLISIATTIFVTGLIAGIFFGVELKTGEDVDPVILTINIGKILCNVVPNSPYASDCNFMLNSFLFAAIIIGIVEILVTANKIGD